MVWTEYLVVHTLYSAECTVYPAYLIEAKEDLAWPVYIRLGTMSGFTCSLFTVQTSGTMVEIFVYSCLPLCIVLDLISGELYNEIQS